MATDHDSPKNGHDQNDRDFPEVLEIIDTFDNNSLHKKLKLIERLRELAIEHEDNPTLARVCLQVAAAFEQRLMPNKDTDEQV